MCLAIPGKIHSIDYKYGGRAKIAKVNFGGIFKEASLEMLPHADIGDYVLVHVGVAISKIDPEEAQKVFEYLNMIGELDEVKESEQIT